MIRDEIHLCDVVLRDAKARKDYTVRDIPLAGNDKDLIWEYPLYRTWLCEHVFTTPARFRKAMTNPNLFIKHIDYKIHLGRSNVSRGTTRTEERP